MNVGLYVRLILCEILNTVDSPLLHFFIEPLNIFAFYFICFCVKVFLRNLNKGTQKNLCVNFRMFLLFEVYFCSVALTSFCLFCQSDWWWV